MILESRVYSLRTAPVKTRYFILLLVLLLQALEINHISYRYTHYISLVLDFHPRYLSEDMLAHAAYHPGVSCKPNKLGLSSGSIGHDVTGIET